MYVNVIPAQFDELRRLMMSVDSAPDQRNIVLDRLTEHRLHNGGNFDRAKANRGVATTLVVLDVVKFKAQK